VNLASYIEQTLLRPEATLAEVEAHCRGAVSAGVFGVCVLPRFVPLARRLVEGSALRVVTVAGFPLGGASTRMKAEEARAALADGAHEIDMVITIGDARSGNFDAIEADVRAVREATAGSVLKVILETGYLSEQQIESAAHAVVRARADFVKTSTGFGPRGASIADVELLVRAIDGKAGIKASGGIRTRAVALEMIRAGANRIGTSSGIEITRDT
jgi:deoxyribose-phosphate aldolase